MPDDMIGIGDTATADAPSAPAPESTPDSGSDNVIQDDGLQGLEQALGGEPAQPAPQRTAPPPPKFDRRAIYGQAQKKNRTWASRQRERDAELQALREEREAWGSKFGDLTETLKGYVQVKGGQPEEIPDPGLDLEGFVAYFQKLSESGLDARIKPALDKLTMLTDRLDAAERAQQDAGARQAEVQRFQGVLADAQDAYAEQWPELAHGAEDRVTSGTEMMARVFGERLGWGKEGEQRGYVLARAIATEAISRGENPAAALDGFYTGIIEDVAEGVLEYYADLGYELPPFLAVTPGMGGAPGNGNGGQPAYHQPLPSPASREMARQEEVRRRAQTVSSAKPRQPARSNGQAASQTAALAASYRRAGQAVDWGAVMKQAQAEAGGNATVAMQLYRAAANVA